MGVTHHRDPIPHLPWRGLGNYQQVLKEAYYKDAGASAPTALCPAIREDTQCADQFNDELSTLFITDHWDSWASPSRPRCFGALSRRKRRTPLLLCEVAQSFGSPFSFCGAARRRALGKVFVIVC